MRTTIVKELEKAAESDKEVFLLTAGLGFKIFDEFRDKFPNNFLDIGVSEQNMINVASGLALEGKKVFCYSIIPFLITRALEQIKINVCLHNLDVNLIGVGAGLSYGMEGPTHHALDDVSCLRALPNIKIICPGDPIEAQIAIKYCLKIRGPKYLRLGRNNDPIVHNEQLEQKSLNGNILRKGKNICLISTGTMLPLAKQIVEGLEKDGIRATLASIPLIKPIDSRFLKTIIKKHKTIYSLEEHHVNGGFGSIISDFITDNKLQARLEKIGLPEKFFEEVGDRSFLLGLAKLSKEKIIEKIKADMANAW